MIDRVGSLGRVVEEDDESTRTLFIISLPVVYVHICFHFSFFVFASSCENMPNTLIEAMAAGMPIVCSNRGPMPEVLKDGGIYFDPENFDSIAIAIEQLFENKLLRDKLAKKAELLSRRYSWKKCANETWVFLKETHALLSE